MNRRDLRSSPVAPKREQERETPPGDEGWCWGKHPVLALLKEAPDRVLKVLLLQKSGGWEPVLALCAAHHIPLVWADAHALDRCCEGENHQGIAAQMAPVPLYGPEDLPGLFPEKGAPALAVVLDHLQDPHNMGAIVRTAEAAGAGAVIFPRRRGVLPGGTVAKASAGAALRLPLVAVTNIARTLQDLQQEGFWTVGLDAGAPESLWSSSALPVRMALVVGAEGEGLSRLVAARCDELRSIPMRGATGSLNASVAAALGLFEWVRQRGATVGSPLTSGGTSR